jgi:hypothetical protein
MLEEGRAAAGLSSGMERPDAREAVIAVSVAG